MITLQIVKSLIFGESAVNSNSTIFKVVKHWKASRNFLYTECFGKFTACATGCLMFLCRFNPLFVCFTCLTEA